MAGLLTVAIGISVLLYPVCAIQNVMGTSYLTPDAKWSVTLYSKTCSSRLWNRKRERENQVVVLRPMSEAAPRPPFYQDSEVLFEIKKPALQQFQLGVTAPEAMTQFRYLSDFEQKHSLLVMCYVNCPLINIRKQLRTWHGVPVHYYIQESRDKEPLIQ